MASLPVFARGIIREPATIFRGYELIAPAATFGEAGQNVLDWKTVGRVAQVVEQRPFKAWVAGSNPAALTNIKMVPLALRKRA